MIFCWRWFISVSGNFWVVDGAKMLELERGLNVPILLNFDIWILFLLDFLMTKFLGDSFWSKVSIWVGTVSLSLKVLLRLRIFSFSKLISVVKIKSLAWYLTSDADSLTLLEGLWLLWEKKTRGRIVRISCICLRVVESFDLMIRGSLLFFPKVSPKLLRFLKAPMFLAKAAGVLFETLQILTLLF